MTESTTSNPLGVLAQLNLFVRDCPSLTGLQSWKSRYQSQYYDSDPESLNTSLDIKTEILKVSIPVSISRLQF